LIGQTLAHYEIIEKLGQGGMGEVYRARDGKLGRDVAIKLLPREMSGDPERIARFEREARTLASLQHANIASIYGFEEGGGFRFLVMELVEGEDLSERLRRGSLELSAAVEVARQIAVALEAAHARGIVHRDLKPANVRLMPDGRVKVLDFGLARAYLGDEAENPDPYNSPTITAAMTQAGVVLGTAAYMSPEQARGSAVDSRADVWAFGCVVLECITGQRLFEGGSVSDVLAAVLRDKLDWSRLPAETPPSLRRLLRRCLERDPSNRLHSLADARLELVDAMAELEERVGAPVEGDSTKRRAGVSAWLPWTLNAALALTTAVLLLRNSDVVTDAEVTRFAIAVKELEGTDLRSPAISPDGRRVLYYAAGQLWIRELDDLTPLALPGTEGARCAFWSPESDEIGYEAEGRLWRVPIHGGAPVAISQTEAEFSDSGGAVWNEEGRILFSTGDSGLFEVAASGGVPVTVLAPDPQRDDDFHTPTLLPDGRGVLFDPHELRSDTQTLDVFRDGERIAVWEFPEGMSVMNPVYSAGHLLFQRRQPNLGIWAIRFSLDEMRARGEPFLVVNQGGKPSATSAGRLVYTHGIEAAHRLVKVDLEGRVDEAPVDHASHIDDAALSPSGKKLLDLAERGAHSEALVHDLARGTQAVLLARAKGFANPFWISESSVGIVHADSTRILAYDLELTVPPRVLFQGTGKGSFQRAELAPMPTHDGRYLLFVLHGPNTSGDLWFVPLDGSGEGRAFLATAEDETDPLPSPTSNLLAYSSGGTTRGQIYLTLFDPENPGLARRWQVSSEGGQYPRWSSDGKHLYYESGGKLMVVDVEWQGGLELSPPRSLFSVSDLRFALNHGYTYDPSGPGFLMVQVGDPTITESEIIVVQNWAEAFRKN